MGKGAAAPLMALDDSVVAMHAALARKQPCTVRCALCAVHRAPCAVRDVEGPKGRRMWPSGKHVPQTRESPEDSLPQWAKGEDAPV